ncbi:MAG: radical SAM protein [Alphaproteobacteria bacterium]|nr:radical SAM protein [Alphaproteobacteria bacterium]
MPDLGDLRPMAKFSDPRVTAKGEVRAEVALHGLETLWINTGTLCNITCGHCYIESSPRNDRLAYITRAEAAAFLDEIARDRLRVSLIGFTGGEPFMNPDCLDMLEDALSRGFECLVLTNAMQPMQRLRAPLAALRERYGARLRLRVSIDDPDAATHDAERGEGAFEKTMEGVAWLVAQGFAVEIAGRRFSGEAEPDLRARFQALFDRIDLKLDAADPQKLVIFPEMAPDADPPEITTACWGILHKDPADVMCATARMVVKRKGAAAPSVLACTLLPYDEQFDLGQTLRAADRPVALNHVYCASFCVLGGASCGAARTE